MIDPQVAFQIRIGAMNYAMATAEKGESGIAILTRAMMYANWTLEPLKLGAQSTAMGEPATARLQ